MFIRSLYSACALLLSALSAGWAADSPRARVVIDGLDINLGPTPLLTQVEPRSLLEVGDYTLHASDGVSAGRATVYDDGNERWLALVADKVPARSRHEFNLQPLAAAALPGISISDDVERSLRIETNGQPFAVLRRGPNKPYLDALIGPGGKAFTRAYPMRDVVAEDRDHPHQRSFWFTHGDVNGVDFWASDPLNGDKPQFGTIAEDERPLVVSGVAIGLIKTRNSWRDHDGRLVCNDVRTLRFWDLGVARVVDCDVLVNASTAPVTFGDTKEGTFGLRIASTMNVNKGLGGRIINAEGAKDGAAWGKRSRWVDYAGPIDGTQVSITILNHPESFRFPTSWHVRDYGLFAANPFGYSDFKLEGTGAHTIAAADTLQFRHRVILRDSQLDIENIESNFQAYAHPPRISITGDN